MGIITIDPVLVLTIAYYAVWVIWLMSWVAVARWSSPNSIRVSSAEQQLSLLLQIIGGLMILLSASSDGLPDLVFWQDVPFAVFLYVVLLAGFAFTGWAHKTPRSLPMAATPGISATRRCLPPCGLCAGDQPMLSASVRLIWRNEQPDCFAQVENAA